MRRVEELLYSVHAREHFLLTQPERLPGISVYLMSLTRPPQDSVAQVPNTASRWRDTSDLSWQSIWVSETATGRRKVVVDVDCLGESIAGSLGMTTANLTPEQVRCRTGMSCA